MAKIIVDYKSFFLFLKRASIKGLFDDVCIHVKRKYGLLVLSGYPNGAGKIFLDLKLKDVKIDEEGYISFLDLQNKVLPSFKLYEDGPLTITSDKETLKIVIEDSTGLRDEFSSCKPQHVTTFIPRMKMADEGIQFFNRNTMHVADKPLPNAISVPFSLLKKADSCSKLMDKYCFRFMHVKDKIKLEMADEDNKKSLPIFLKDGASKGDYTKCEGVVSEGFSEVLLAIEEPGTKNQMVWIFFGEDGICMTDEKTYWHCIIFVDESYV